MVDTTAQWLDNLFAAVAIFVAIWAGRKTVETALECPAFMATLRRFRREHVLPMLGIGVTGIVLAAFALAILPR